jgi:D-alanine--D-alanine ligase
MLKRRGIVVSGTDSTASETTDSLERAGIPVAIGHQSAKISKEDQVILSDAIVLEDSPEVAQARHLDCLILRRSQLLGWLLRDNKIICVTGTHGKTTTTSMIGAGLLATGANPTIVVGAFVPEFGGPVVEGDSNLAVVEACEAYDSFHDLKPDIVVLTNLELDHVDFHENWENLKASVLRFVRRIPSGGALVYCADDQGASEIAGEFEGKKIAYSLSNGRDLELSAPGDHNRLNAVGALAAIEQVGYTIDSALPGVAAFRGAERRLQILHDDEVTIVDDYAHHPTEIRASISALREKYPDRRLVVVFQPHLYSRTAGMITEFALALDLADIVLITDIYPAREAPMPGISSYRIVELLLKPCRYVPSRHFLVDEALRLIQPNDVIVGMGAGNISEFAPQLKNNLNHPTLAEIENGAALSIVIAYGGDSAEREVSLCSGLAVQKALESNGHRVRLIDFTDLLCGRALNSAFRFDGGFSRIFGQDRVDVVFLAVHGTNAEDGAIQGLMELLHVPYTGSGVQASAIAMDKGLTKAILEREGIRVPKGQKVRSLCDPITIQTPLIVKPNAQGSTVGLSFVDDIDDLPTALEKSLGYGDTLVEEWVQGMEISVPVLGNRALPPVEIAPVIGQYDFANKYLPGATEEIIPARMPETKLAEAQEIALKCHRALGCRGATRTDMMVRENGRGEIVVLEVNTLPGLTATSLLPNSAKAEGISMEQLCQWMVVDAMRCHAKTT